MYRCTVSWIRYRKFRIFPQIHVIYLYQLILIQKLQSWSLSHQYNIIHLHLIVKLSYRWLCIGLCKCLFVHSTLIVIISFTTHYHCYCWYLHLLTITWSPLIVTSVTFKVQLPVINNSLDDRCYRIHHVYHICNRSSSNAYMLI